MTGTATSPLRGLRVLVAEDDLLIAQLMDNILVSLRCTVIGPVDGLNEALQAIRTNDIDGALLDVQLGEASIYPALDELAPRGIPIILITGHDNLAGSPALLNNAPLLAKPFKLQQLENMMSSTFRRRDRREPRPP